MPCTAEALAPAWRILQQALPTQLPAASLVEWAELNLVHHLLHHHLHEGQDEAAPTLLPGVLQSHRAQVRLTAALREISAALTLRDVPLVVLKGASLGARYYQPSALRPYTDLDLLLPIDQRDEIHATLRELGYSPYHLLAPEDAAAFGLGTKEDWHRDDGVRLDLNYSLHHADALATHAELASYPVFEHADGTFRLLPKAKEYTYLCRHAAEQHTFQRLIWLIDLALMQRDLSLADHVEIASLAKDWGCERSVQAVQFSISQLLGTECGNGGPFPSWARLFGRLDTASRQAKPAYLALKFLLRDKPLNAVRYALARRQQAAATLPPSLILRESLLRFGRVTLAAHGRSMFPTIVPGDILELTEASDSCRPGDVVLALLPGEACVIHRLIATRPYLLTRGDNASIDDPPSVAILARVTCIQRTPLSRLRRYAWGYVFAWRRTLPNAVCRGP